VTADEKVEQSDACRLVDVPESMRLSNRDLQAWHLEELAANPVEQYVTAAITVSGDDRLNASRTRVAWIAAVAHCVMRSQMEYQRHVRSDRG